MSGSHGNKPDVVACDRTAVHQKLSGIGSELSRLRRALMIGMAHHIDLLESDALTSHPDTLHGLHGIDVARPAILAHKAKSIIECLTVVHRLLGRLDANVLNSALAQRCRRSRQRHSGIIVSEFAVVAVHKRHLEGDSIAVDCCHLAFYRQAASGLQPSLRLSVAAHIVHLHIFHPLIGHGFAHPHHVAGFESGGIGNIYAIRARRDILVGHLHGICAIATIESTSATLTVGHHNSRVLRTGHHYDAAALVATAAAQHNTVGRDAQRLRTHIAPRS